jgi:hypothetical protein
LTAECMAPGCGKSIPHPRLLCVPHYAALPTEVRSRVVRHLMSGNSDSARIVVSDYYRARKSEGESLNGNGNAH